MRSRTECASLLCLAHVSKWFGHNGEGSKVLDEICFTAKPAHLHLILGPSGSGKTTLLTLMAGLQRPSAGSVFLFGRDVTEFTAEDLREMRARSIGFVFQDFQLIDSLTVYQNIALVLKFAGRSRAQARKTIQELLAQFDITYLQDRKPWNLSHGEKQRVAIVRAVANQPQLIIADEPTASLESTQGLDVIHLLRDYAREYGRSVIVASHDLRLAGYADTVQRIQDGILCAPMDRSAGTIRIRQVNSRGRLDSCDTR